MTDSDNDKGFNEVFEAYIEIVNKEPDSIFRLWAKAYYFFTFPFFVIVTVTTLSAGLILSLNGFLSAFQRSGAVLVCFTILSVAFHHEIESILESDGSLSAAKKNDDKGYIFSLSRMKRNDFAMGLLGTAVWGFGDLPF